MILATDPDLSTESRYEFLRGKKGISVSIGKKKKRLVPAQRKKKKKRLGTLFPAEQQTHLIAEPRRNKTSCTYAMGKRIGWAQENQEPMDRGHHKYQTTGQHFSLSSEKFLYHFSY